jgi:hypothetical protein
VKPPTERSFFHIIPVHRLFNRYYYIPATVLSRVQAFLPQLKASNALLARRDPKSIDIENVGDEEGQYIQMDLGLVRNQRDDFESKGEFYPFHINATLSVTSHFCNQSQPK